MRANLALEEDVVRLVDVGLKAFGRIDVLVNNAGISMPYNQLAWDVKPKGWDLVTAINVRTPFRLSSLLIQQMKMQISIGRSSGENFDIVPLYTS